MDYKYIEGLVIKCKNNNKEAFIKLIEEFKPVIYGYVKRFYIHGYDNEDLISESFKILLHAINKYDINKHRFVAYGINAIKNNLLYLHRQASYKHTKEGTYFDDENELNLIPDNTDYNEVILNNVLFDSLRKELTPTEMEVVDLLILKDMKIKEYASIKSLKYSTAAKRKTTVYNKLKNSKYLC